MSLGSVSIIAMTGKQIHHAHSPDSHGRWHPLAQHLRSVAESALVMAERWPWAEEARLAGLLHDLGKYGDLFQRRLRGMESGLDHWSVGALEALLSYHALGAALAIEGHHVGLQPASATDVAQRFDQTRQGRSPFGAQLRLSDADKSRLLARAAADGIQFGACATPSVPLTGNPWATPIARMLDLRMLFSCLVDADFLDTEAHFNGTPQGKKKREPGPRLHADAALRQLESFMAASVRGKQSSSAAVADVRAELWQAVSTAADSPTGLFTLTAPTGSGKTLAMLQFALRHALRNGLSRVVLAVPYLSIIEQTAREYDKVFAGAAEHHVL